MDGGMEGRLRRCLSEARLAEYEARSPSDFTAALRLHCWNVEVSGAFYEVLHFVEVALRNSVHATLGSRYDTEDWWNADRSILQHVARAKVDSVIADLLQRKPEWTADDVVARLTLGFWVGLFGRRYEHTLWYRGLRSAVPGYADRRRAPLYAELDRLRTLRNRIAHHQPIYQRNLMVDHQRALRVLRYVSPGLEIVVSKHSRVPGLLMARPDAPEGGHGT